MAYDTLILGPFEFTEFAVPPNMPYGGAQQTVVQKMAGGKRRISTMGPDDDDVSWGGLLWGSDALSKMVFLNTLRRNGDPLLFSWAGETRMCVITKFEAKVERITCISYTITVTLDDDGDSSGIVQAIGDLVGGDLNAALSFLS